MNMRPVRLAIIGCGRITEDFHLPAALKATGIELTALVDRDVERAGLLARMYGCRCEISATLDPVLDKVDGVLIATPNHTHVAVARAALEHGLPVLIEKPLTTIHADAVQLCELAQQKGAFISVGFMTRHYPVVRLMRRLIDEDFLGRLICFHFEHGARGGWAPHSGYNLHRDQSGGGVLVVSGTHFLDRMLFWFGAPKSFCYADDSHGGVEANCKAWMEFGSGLTGTLFFSKTIDLANRFVMETNQYRIEIPWSQQAEIKLHPRVLPGIEMTLEEPSAADHNDCFQIQLEEFACVIREGGSPTVDGETGALSVKLCEDFYARREQLDEPWIRYDSSPMSAP
jgi:predicted dehydrogenase